jgi:hypothetical protein
METVFSVGSVPRLYNEDPRPSEGGVEVPFFSFFVASHDSQGSITTVI